MKILITEIKNLLKWFNSRYKLAELRISKLDDRLRLYCLRNKKRKRVRKNEQIPEGCGTPSNIPTYI